MIKNILLVSAISIASPTVAAAYCPSPSFNDAAPNGPGHYERPSVPYCLGSYSYSGKHTCDQWELDAYQREVDDYIRKLNDYLREASEFAQAAIDHVGEVETYARCEAREVASQHE